MDFHRAGLGRGGIFVEDTFLDQIGKLKYWWIKCFILETMALWTSYVNSMIRKTLKATSKEKTFWPSQHSSVGLTVRR